MPGHVVTVRRPADLDERAVGSGGPEESLLPLLAVEVDVHELVPERAHVLDRRLDVVRLEGDVVKALAALLEETGQESLPERLEQLDLAAVRELHLDPAPRVGVATHQVLAAERVAVELQRVSDRVDRYGDMIELEPRAAHDHCVAGRSCGSLSTVMSARSLKNAIRSRICSASRSGSGYVHAMSGCASVPK